MRLRPKVKVIGGEGGPNLLGSWVGVAYKQLERMRRQYDIGVMKLPHFKWEFVLEGAHITIVAKRWGRDEITVRPLAFCPPELFSGLVDPQQPTIIEVLQPDETLRNEFSRYWRKILPAPDFGPTVESATSHKLSAESLVNNYAGLYTGRMKGLVQDQLGRGGGVKWDFRYNRTHGIYTASDDTVWAIQISAAGVSAARLSLCPFEAEDTVDGFSARVRAFPTAAAVQIASADEVAPAYGGHYALWPECGWAFSMSGSKACNVVLSEPDEYLVASLFEITISETSYEVGETTVRGPGAASMSLLEEDFFWGQRVTHVRVPRYPTPSAPNSLVSIDWWRNQHAAPSDSSRTPIHAYYDGETMVVSRHVRSSSAYTHTDGATGTQSQVGFESPAMPEVPMSFSVSGSFTEVNEIPDPTTYYAAHNSSSNRLRRVASGAIIQQTRTGTWSERSNLNLDVLTIPFGDRESVYQTRRLRSVSNGTASGATATYLWTQAHYKHSNVGTSIIFETPFDCQSSDPFNHPAWYMSGTQALGNVVFDDASGPVHGNLGALSSARFGTAVQENNPLIYHVKVTSACVIVSGGTPLGVAHDQFNKMVDLGLMDPNVFAFEGVRDDSLDVGPEPGNDRWAARFRGRMRRISDGRILDFGGNIRMMPAIFIHRTSTADKRGQYTHGAQSISDSEESYETKAALTQQLVVLPLADSQDLYEEMAIYDAAADDVQRILVVARDASAAGLQLYSERVFPTMGAPIGPLLAGTEEYPLESVSSVQLSWIGKP